MKKKKLSKLKHKYLLIVRDEATLEWQFSFKLTRLNVFIAVGIIAILLIIITTYIIAFTPLREYIPGYSNVGFDKKVRELTLKADSLEKTLEAKDAYLYNLKKIIQGKDFTDTIGSSKQSAISSQQTADYKNIKNKKSVRDSLFREEVENSDKYNLSYGDESANQYASIRNYFFFTPLKGLVTNNFNMPHGHYGIDIVAKKNEPIKATLDGTVLFCDWTIKTGYVIAIQHQNNIISIYKHNSALMKKEGAYVKAGEVIAIIGNTGELSTGPHLHFELWYDGKAVNPKEFMRF